MTDDLTQRVPREAARIDIHEDDDVRYWCKRFDCAEADLRDAVNAVGSMAATVQAWLRNYRPRKS